MNKKNKILFFCMIFAACHAFSQDTSLKAGNMLIMQQVFKPAVQPSVQLITLKKAIAPNLSSIFLSPNYYASQLGFFCRQEIKFDKISRVPFRFRLGSVEECNRLEGKVR